MTSSHRHGGTQLRPCSANEHDLRYEIAERIRRRGARPVGLLGRRRHRRRQGDRALPRSQSKVAPLDHKGRYFQVKGPLNIERCPHGHPLMIQAGGSEPGPGPLGAHRRCRLLGRQRRQGAAKAAYDGLKARVAKYGREPERAGDPAGRHADHRPTDERGQGAARPAAELADADQRADAGVAAASATTSPAIRSTARCRSCRKPNTASRSRARCWTWRGART